MVATVVVLLLLGSDPVQGQVAQPPDAGVVVGAQEPKIRSSPKPACEARAKVPLGASIKVTGTPTDCYVLVE